MSADENSRINQRIQSLFEDINQLAKGVANAPVNLANEIENLRARLSQLEKDVREKIADSNSEHTARKDETKTSVPLIYEKDRIGFSFSNDRLESLSPITPSINGGSSLIAPLSSTDGDFGEIRIAPQGEREWTEQEISLVREVAQRASLQIQNLRLLAATERARTEAENATRRFTQQGWSSFLDAIERSERIGFAYDQNSLTPFQNKIVDDHGYIQPLIVTGEKVGALFLESNPEQVFSNDDKVIINSVARQLSQQVENLRLLSETARARADAENATRLLTRDGWKSFVSQTESRTSLRYLYDSNEVTTLKEGDAIPNITFSQPLTIRGEAIGQLGISGWQEISPEDAKLAASIAAQVSIHIETLRLTEELQRRAEELEKLDRLKSSFLANMSHELRTPLNSILGFADVILEELDGPLTENMKNDLGLIYKNGQHLLHLINDVLDMAKIEAGRMNLHPEKVRVHEILEEVTSITSTFASEKNLSLFVESGSDSEVEIFADRTRLRQVMINLINNAIKFTEHGKISMFIKRNDSRVLISVKDSGIGIPPDKLESVFQEFTQVDTSTTRKAGGTGLGLPISRRLIEMHGGKLWAESNGVLGEGSVFFVDLPIEAEVSEHTEKLER